MPAQIRLPGPRFGVPGGLLAALLSLSGCGLLDTTQKFPPICPSLSLLDDASDVTRFRGDGRDITDIVYDGRITAVPAQCTRVSPTIIKTTLQVKASLTRGAAATGRTASIGYLVTVTEDAKILDQQDYTLAAAFAPNVDRVDLTGQEITLLFPVSAQKTAAAYKVFISFRLTPDELAANRKRGPR